MYRRYYSYPVKQKSHKTLETQDLSDFYLHIKQISELDKLTKRDLDFQKDLFEYDLKQITQTYSSQNYEKKIKELKSAVDSISKSYKELEKFYKKNLKYFKIKKKFFIQDSLWFPVRVEIQELCIDKEKLSEILTFESSILKKIKSTNIDIIRRYFLDLIFILRFYYLFFKVKVFSDNSKSFSYHLKHSGVFKEDFKSDPTILLKSILPFYTDEFDPESIVQSFSLKEAFKTLIIPNCTVPFKDLNKIDDLGDKERNIIKIDTTNYEKYTSNKYIFDDEPYCLKRKIPRYDITRGNPDHLFSDRKVILNPKALILFNKEIKRIIENILRKIELTSRKQTKKRVKKENFGYVYVLKSIGYPGMYKIGSTYGLAEERAEELSGTNVPDPWTVATKIKILDALYYEKQVHKMLAQYRYRKGREFFKLDLSIIKECLKNIMTISDNGRKRVSLPVLKRKVKINV